MDVLRNFPARVDSSMVEQYPFKVLVLGSSPSQPTFFSNRRDSNVGLKLLQKTKKIATNEQLAFVCVIFRPLAPQKRVVRYGIELMGW